jgi:hypothetical protein
LSSTTAKGKNTTFSILLFSKFNYLRLDSVELPSASISFSSLNFKFNETKEGSFNSVIFSRQFEERSSVCNVLCSFNVKQSEI